MRMLSRRLTMDRINWMARRWMRRRPCREMLPRRPLHSNAAVPRLVVVVTDQVALVAPTRFSAVACRKVRRKSVWKSFSHGMARFRKRSCRTTVSPTVLEALVLSRLNPPTTWPSCARTAMWTLMASRWKSNLRCPVSKWLAPRLASTWDATTVTTTIAAVAVATTAATAVAVAAVAATVGEALTAMDPSKATAEAVAEGTVRRVVAMVVGLLEAVGTMLHRTAVAAAGMGLLATRAAVRVVRPVAAALRAVATAGRVTAMAAMAVAAATGPVLAAATTRREAVPVAGTAHRVVGTAVRTEVTRAAVTVPVRTAGSRRRTVARRMALREAQAMQAMVSRERGPGLRLEAMTRVVGTAGTGQPIPKPVRTEAPTKRVATVAMQPQPQVGTVATRTEPRLPAVHPAMVKMRAMGTVEQRRKIHGVQPMHRRQGSHTISREGMAGIRTGFMFSTPFLRQLQLHVLHSAEGEMKGDRKKKTSGRKQSNICKAVVVARRASIRYHALRC
eukprot:m.51943 g.51943  ORF g.51943 m.51943 type:complete len:504 (-) comp7344_c0_seq1:162-1673(-)